MQPFAGEGLFFLLRHGETPWNVERRVMGRLAIELSDEGRRQVVALAPHLEGLGIAAVWTSPLERARATADLVAAELGGVPVHEEPGITEVHYGAWEGRTFPELQGDPGYHEFCRDPLATAVPGGGESLLEVRARVYEAMAHIARQAAGRPALVVSHGDPLRLILAGCMGLELSQLRRFRIDNGALSAIEVGRGRAEVKFVNVRPDLAAMLRGEGAAARIPRENGQPGAGDPANEGG